MGIDGLSISMVLLTALLCFLCIFASWGIEKGGQGLLRALPPARRRHDGRVLRARLFSLLHFLGSHALADVLPHRHLGRAAARVCGHQVLPLHAGRQRADAARDSGALFQQRTAYLRHDRVDRPGRQVRHKNVAHMAVRSVGLGLSACHLDGAVHRLRHQDPGLPVPHLAARRPRRGAHGDLRHPGRRAAQDGHLRHSPHQLSDAARGNGGFSLLVSRRSRRAGTSSTARFAPWRRKI